MSLFVHAVVLTGPTGGGKSALALDLAEQLGGEIVAADSMTVYRGLDIGTAKPTLADQARVRHHLLDELDPWQSADVAWWLGRATEACADIIGRGKLPLIVGGTPFYIKALLYGLFAGPPADAAVRATLEAELAATSAVALHARLAVVDPPTAARLHPNDLRRVIRALEVFTVTGQPISALQQSWSQPPTPVPVAVLDWPRAELYARIDARVDMMLAAGWAGEADRLSRAERPPGREAAKALGYAELAAVGRGELELPVARRLIQTATRQFAKRQLTFLRGLPSAVWVSAGHDMRPMGATAAAVREIWGSSVADGCRVSGLSK